MMNHCYKPHEDPNSKLASKWLVAGIMRAEKPKKQGLLEKITPAFLKGKPNLEGMEFPPKEVASNLPNPEHLLWRSLSAAMESLEVDPEEDNLESVNRMIPHISEFMMEAADELNIRVLDLQRAVLHGGEIVGLESVDFRHIGFTPDYVAVCDTVGVRLDWDRGDNFISVMAKPSYENFVSMYVNRNGESRIVPRVTPNYFVEQAIRDGIFNLNKAVIAG